MNRLLQKLLVHLRVYRIDAETFQYVAFIPSSYKLDGLSLCKPCIPRRECDSVVGSELKETGKLEL